MMPGILGNRATGNESCADTDAVRADRLHRFDPTK
jgi:hypothetical protein